MVREDTVETNKQTKKVSYGDTNLHCSNMTSLHRHEGWTQRLDQEKAA